MVTYTDVSSDPTAFTRSRLRQSQIDEATDLGFGSLAFISMGIDDAPADAPEKTSALVTAAMFHPYSPMTLGLCNSDEVGDDYCLKTLFTDGSIIMTETEPQKNRFRLMLGVTSAPRYGVHLEFVATTSIADLVAHHVRRVEGHTSSSRQPVPTHDLRAHFAMKKRWREIADPRMRWQKNIAMTIGVLTMIATIVGPIVGSPFLSKVIGKPLALMLATAGAIGGVPLGFAAFVFSLLYIAPIFARFAPAPAMRPAHELLGLADSVWRGPLPIRPTPATGLDGAPARPRITLPPGEVARLQQTDLLVTMANAMFLPVVAMASLALFGTARAWLAISAIIVIDAIVQLVTKKTRTDLFRDRYVPDLVRAEASIPELGCEGGACAIPKRWGVFIRLAIGVLGFVGASMILKVPHEGVPLDVLGQWAIVGVFVFVTALSRTKKRHAMLASA